MVKNRENMVVNLNIYKNIKYKNICFQNTKKLCVSLKLKVQSNIHVAIFNCHTILENKD